MYPKPIERLIRQFQKLPGIGPKQGAKFAFRVLRMSEEEVSSFASAIKDIKKETSRCAKCRLTYERDGDSLCHICRNPNRDHHHLCVVETERDVHTIEATKAFNGVYHVLGEQVSLTADSFPPEITRLLEERIKKLPPNGEVILAMNATTDGQATALYLERMIAPFKKNLTRLGRGLSSGIEIEYADRDTLLDAFKNRK